MLALDPLDCAFDPPSTVAENVREVITALETMAEHAATGGNDTADLDEMVKALCSVDKWLVDYGRELWRRHMGVGEIHA